MSEDSLTEHECVCIESKRAEASQREPHVETCSSRLRGSGERGGILLPPTLSIQVLTCLPRPNPEPLVAKHRDSFDPLTSAWPQKIREVRVPRM